MSSESGPVLVRGGPREGLYFRTRAGLDRLLDDPVLSKDVVRPRDKLGLMRYRGQALYIATDDDWHWLQVALGLDYFRRKT